MAITLIGFIAARLAITHWIRPNLVSPAHTSAALNSAQNVFEANGSGGTTFVSFNAVIPNAWTISSTIVDKTDHAPTGQALQQFLRHACPNVAAPPPPGKRRPQPRDIPGLHHAAIREIPPRRRLPTRQPLLGHPDARTRRLRRARHHPGRKLRLGSAPPTLLEARRESRRHLSVVLSSHLVADLERVCDYLIVLVASRVQLAGEVEELLASHCVNHRASRVSRRCSPNLPRKRLTASHRT
jgi:hypothetical protein